MSCLLGLSHTGFTDAGTAVLLLRRRSKRRYAGGEGSLKVLGGCLASTFYPATLNGLGVFFVQNQFYLGCSGFYYSHWSGKFYPAELAKTKWLSFYTQHFRTVEVNNTFYRYPTEKLLLGWHQKTPPEFKFTLKANRIITHLRRFSQTERYTQDFYNLAHLLKEKLLCVLFQLPPTVNKDMSLLENAASQMDSSVLNVLEFRHESWWDREVYDFLERHRLVFCSVSASELPDDLVKTGDAVYVRFHGRDGWYMQNYSDKELEEWAQKIRSKNAGQVLCYFNNDYNANAPRNCLTLRGLLE